jgi:hypothetical protein
MDVKDHLRTTKASVFGANSGMTQADILRKYMSLPQMRDSLKRDEKTFST